LIECKAPTNKVNPNIYIFNLIRWSYC